MRNDTLFSSVTDFLRSDADPGTDEYRDRLRSCSDNLLYAAVRVRGFAVDELEPGDWIAVQQANGVFHHGVYAGNNNAIHGARSKGKVVITPMEKFAHGREVRLVYRHDDPWNRFAAWGRAYSRLNEPYHWLFGNCEHFASEVVVGKRESQQVDFLFSVGAIVAGHLLKRD